MPTLPPLHTLDERAAQGRAREALERCLTDERDETCIPVEGEPVDARRWYEFLGKHATKWAREILRDQTVKAEIDPNADEEWGLLIDVSTGQVIEVLTAASLQARKAADRRRERRFLIHIRIVPAARAATAAGAVKRALDTITKDVQCAYTMPDGATFGLLIRTKMNAYQLRSAILRGRHEQTSPLTAGDDVLILELGTSYADQGMGRVTTWLQHHPPRQ